MDEGNRVGWYEAFAVLAGLALFALARANRLTFPFPWNDEARFYLPAQWWVNHGSFDSVTVNAPHGIFWLPDGFTVLLGLVLRMFGQSIEIARAACEWMVAAGVAIFAFEFRSISGSRTTGALATLLLLTPPVVFAANMVRMEAPVFLLIAVTLLLHLNGYFVGAGALLFGSLLIHPALGLAAMGYAVLCWAAGQRGSGARRVHALEWVLLAAVLLGWLSEGIHIALHAELFRLHMANQITQKEMRGSLIARLIKPQGIILFICSAAIAVIVKRRRVRERVSEHKSFLGIAVIALGVQMYAVLGSELTYNVYSVSLGPAIVFCLAASEVRCTPSEVALGAVGDGH